MAILYSMCVPHPPLIIPEIGQGEEKTISNTIQSYKSIMKYVSTLPIETVIVISPHAIAYSDYIHISSGIHASGDFRQFGAGNVRIGTTSRKSTSQTEISSLIQLLFT